MGHSAQCDLKSSRIFRNPIAPRPYCCSHFAIWGVRKSAYSSVRMWASSGSTTSKIARCVEVKGKKTQTERDITENFAIGTRGLGVKVPEFIRASRNPSTDRSLQSPQSPAKATDDRSFQGLTAQVESLPPRCAGRYSPLGDYRPA